MSKTAIYFTVIIIILIALVAVYLIYLNNMSTNTGITLNSTQSAATNTIRIGSSVQLGSFLVDANGKTLYYFANDVSGKSNCTGQCSAIWPAFYTQNIAVPSDLNATDFGQITTSAGTNQTTYEGWPLYYYSGDTNSGDTNGQNFQNIWFVAANPFYNVLLMNNSASKIYLADVTGKALYYFKSETKGPATADPVSRCTGICLSTWTIFDQSQIIAPALLKFTDFKEFTRSDGQTQLSYKGSPLYLYSSDANSGDTKGNGMASLWYLVKP
jgi:predicted lipoprotein with Yx(FWY)xxD motif